MVKNEESETDFENELEKKVLIRKNDETCR
jgi:hypothetical protein